MDDLRAGLLAIDGATLGAKVRARRKSQGHTLAKVSELTGLSISALSKIENDQVSPTFANLMRLAAGLQISLSGLVSLNDEVVAASSRITVSRREDTRFRSTPKYDMYALCSELRHKRMTPLIERVKADDPSRLDGMVSHAGEEFFFVLNGAIEVHTEHYTPVRLDKGDSAYLDSTMAHTLVAMDGDDADILMVWLGPNAAGGEDGASMAEAILNQDC
ncbi:MAG: transcriptional regulator [Alphaproteobacteria bacterium]|nr:transcriptional regulator [Alphaproteobacteria bacterium]HCP00323.1 transcriptional regulator [Rhodospirillaceae bacterium]